MASTQTGTSPDVITALAAVLERDLQLQPCKDLAGLRGLSQPGFLLRPPVLTAAAHYDLQPAILVYDPVLGTVGLVEELSAEALEADLTRKIDRAANLRQLLLLKAEEASPSVLNLSVELVLVLPYASRVESKDVIGDILQQIARETTYLRVIGVNVLPCPANNVFEKNTLRRAFAWLLRDTSEWFRFLAEKCKDAPAALLPPGQSWSLTLKHYRLAGTRVFTFQENCKLHLLHGHNGCGKSTFSEAIELLLARAIQRLDEAGEKDYFRVVRYRSAPVASDSATASPAEVTLVCGDTQRAVALPPSQQPVFTPAAETSSPLEVTSFRLDQRFMDKLVRSTEAERAGLFLRAFFPKDSYLFRNLLLFEHNAVEDFARLPKRFQEGAPPDPDKLAEHVVGALQWTQRSATDQPAAWQPGILEVLDAALPLPAANIRLLVRLSPRLESLLKSWESDPTRLADIQRALEELDEALASIPPTLPEKIKSLETTARVVDEFKNWRASQQTERGQFFEPSLNEWLELEALSDLAGKYYDVVATLQNVQGRNWRLREDYAGVLPDTPLDRKQVERVRQARDKLRDEALKAKSKVQAWTRPEGESAAETGGAKPRESLTVAEIAALNEVDPWLPSLQLAATLPKFGDLFRDALKTNAPQTANKAHIGTPGGLQTVADEIAGLLAACNNLQSAKLGVTPARERFTQAQSAWKVFHDLVLAQQAVTTALSKEVVGTGGQQSKLSAALNELLALFNAAPWAYPDISLNGEIAESKQTLGLETTGGAKAELRFNTAELNSLTLALFLLCAPGVDNPFRLLVLDDPLQNMDEMTVTAVARGLAQLVRVYPSGWQIAALFHGEENTATIRNEAECAVYHLPWLSPAAMESGELEIKPKKELSTIGRGLQKLDEDFLAVAPAPLGRPIAQTGTPPKAP